MLKLNPIVTTFAGAIAFLASKNFALMPVTLDETFVSADGGGQKKVLAGTFLCKAGNLYRPYIAAVPAEYTIAGGAANSHVKFVAVPKGTLGNAVKFRIVEPGAETTEVSVEVINNTVVITPKAGVGPGFVITSTAAEIVAAVNAAKEAQDMLVASLPGVETGAAAVLAIAATALANGVNAPGDTGMPVGILAEECNLSNFDANAGITHTDVVTCAMYQGRVYEARLPVAPDAAVKAALSMISWA